MSHHVFERSLRLVGACEIEGQLTSMDACAAGRGAWLNGGGGEWDKAGLGLGLLFTRHSQMNVGLSLARLPAELKHISKRRKRK